MRHWTAVNMPLLARIFLIFGLLIEEQLKECFVYCSLNKTLCSPIYVIKLSILFVNNTKMNQTSSFVLAAMMELFK